MFFAIYLGSLVLINDDLGVKCGRVCHPFLYRNHECRTTERDFHEGTSSSCRHASTGSRYVGIHVSRS